MKTQLVILSTFLLLGTFLKAQNVQECTPPSFKNNWYIGINGGIMPYYGSYSSLDEDDNIESEYPLGFGIYVGKKINQVFSLRGDAIYGQVKAAKSIDRRDLSDKRRLEGDYFNTGITTEIDILNIFSYSNTRVINPYLLFGINAGYLKGKTWIYKGDNVDDKIQTIDSDLRSFELGAMGGVGIGFRFSKNFSLNLESKMIMHDNDFDGGYFASASKSASNKFWYSSIGFTYTFNNKKFLTSNEQHACMERMLKPHQAPVAAPVVDIEGPINDLKKQITPLQQQIDALKKENTDLKNQVQKLEDSQKTAVKAPVNDYVNWDDLGTKSNETNSIASVFFSFNKSNIEKSQESVLDNVVAYVKKNPSIKKLVLEGYADKVGTAEANKQISLQRAENVRKELIKRGVNATLLETAAVGTTTKFSANDTDLNRRVFFRIEK